MAFANEFIPEPDFVKYDIAAINRYKVGQILAAPDDCAEIRARAMQSVRHCYTVGAGIAAYRRLLGLPAARREAAA